MLRPLRGWLLILAAAAHAVHAQDAADAIAVSVKRDGPRVIIDVRLLVAATPGEVWEVLNDYEGAPRFISKLHESKVIWRGADRLIVSQKGTAGFGPFSVEVESVREVRLMPPLRTQSHAIAGNAGPARTTTELLARPEGTEIVHHAESEPQFWIPPVIGPAAIERDTGARFRELQQEILRRRRGSTR